MRNIAIIPARSGSKGLPDKNIKLLCGKPLLCYSIEAALKSNMFDTVHVSTDSEHYAKIARSYGADVPFLRSMENSCDTTSSWSAVLEVLNTYAKLGSQFDNFMLLQPTSPLRKYDDIIAAFAIMKEKNANAIVSVCQGEYHHMLPADGGMTSFMPNELKNARRQDADNFYRINGAIYLANVAYFFADQDIYRSACFAYIMDNNRSIDIDEELDFLFAEAAMIYTYQLLKIQP